MSHPGGTSGKGGRNYRVNWTDTPNAHLLQGHVRQAGDPMMSDNDFKVMVLRLLSALVRKHAGNMSLHEQDDQARLLADADDLAKKMESAAGFSAVKVSEPAAKRPTKP